MSNPVEVLTNDPTLRRDGKVLITIGLGTMLSLGASVFVVGQWVKGAEKDLEAARNDRTVIRQEVDAKLGRVTDGIDTLRSVVSDLTRIVANSSVNGAAQAQRIDGIIQRVERLERLSDGK